MLSCLGKDWEGAGCGISTQGRREMETGSIQPLPFQAESATGLGAARNETVYVKAPREKKNSSGLLFDIKRIWDYKTDSSIYGTCSSPVGRVDCPHLCQGRDLNTLTHFSLLPIHVCLSKNIWLPGSTT